MHKFGLQFLQTRFGLLALGQIADEAGEETSVTGFHLADSQLHWKSRAILALADHDAADANDPAFARRPVAFEVTIMTFTIRCRHQDFDVLPERFGHAVAEQPLGGAAERLHSAVLVDDDHCFRHSVENRLQMRLARKGVARHCNRAPTAAMEQFAAPRDSNADAGEGGTEDEKQPRKLGNFSYDKVSGADAQC